ncbi:cysteine hydrolase family protein [Streptomyces sp. NBC_01716]|uniref:cysteine hydrolase family protein n=1 Tax=Streptomyces sp. NBC_01716 TaxID=2975917 RepID=UPI002E325AE8|nr:cysteine hydrolase [Streptomyces sp. NBC_01716]
MAGRQALLVGDYQTGITGAFDFCAPVLPTVTRLVEGAREKDILLVFCVAALRESGVDLSPRNRVMNQFFPLGQVFHEGGPGPQVDPRLSPQRDEPIITKRRASAFHGSELDLVLRSNNVTHLAIGGVATSAMVLATTLAALDLDYDVTVLGDCCVDPEPAVHDFLLQRVLPARGAVVVDSDDWLALLPWSGAGGGRQGPAEHRTSS